MPILEIVSATAPKEINAFTKRLSAVFAEYIGKPESYCLVTFTKTDSLTFAGSDEPGFYAKVTSIGHIDNERNSKLTKAITEELQKELGIADGRGYFHFMDAPAENIGFRKDTFANIASKNF
ncbi:Tautomerase/MIF superfamily [Choanephora cucurbitarum]|nr:Tautomerase/MIF superfamily [Choanephora cucurbitarum]